MALVGDPSEEVAKKESESRAGRQEPEAKEMSLLIRLIYWLLLAEDETLVGRVSEML